MLAERFCRLGRVGASLVPDPVDRPPGSRRPDTTANDPDWVFRRRGARSDVQAADLGNRHDAAIVGVHGARFGRVLGEREVRASVLIVPHVGAEQTPEVTLAEHDHVVEALAPD